MTTHVRRNGKLVAALEDMPEEMQRQMYAELAAKFDPVRTGSAVGKEQKVKSVAAVLQVLSGFSIPEQRTILKFAIDVLDLATQRWWRKNKGDDAE